MSTAILSQTVPEVTVQVTDGKSIRLSELQGHWVILYFYPKDNTPGCTQEAQDFRDLSPEFEKLGARIFGVSRDSLKSHDGFKCKHALPFALISDTDESLCQMFDVIKLKNMYGKQVRGIERSTFLIDPQGRLVREWRKVTVKGHAQAVLQSLRELLSTR